MQEKGMRLHMSERSAHLLYIFTVMTRIHITMMQALWHGVRGQGNTHLSLQLRKMIQCLVRMFVLTETQELHEHIATMSQRISALEEALRRGTAEGENHPLLHPDLQNIKHPPDTLISFQAEHNRAERQGEGNLNLCLILSSYCDDSFPRKCVYASLHE